MHRPLYNATLVDTTGKNPKQRVINDRPIDGHIKVLDLATHTERYVEYEALCKGIAVGQFRVERPGLPTPSEILKQRPEDDEALGAAMELVAMVKREMQATGASVNKAYGQLLEKESKGELTDLQGKLPSKATIYRHVQNDRQCLPLLRGNHAKGNRTARFSDAVRDLIAEQADQLYLVPKSKWSLKSLAEHVTLLAQEQGHLPQERSLSRDYVLKVILEDLSSDPEKDRMDPKDAIAAKAVARNRIRVRVDYRDEHARALIRRWIVRGSCRTSSGPARVDRCARQILRVASGFRTSRPPSLVGTNAGGNQRPSRRPHGSWALWCWCSTFNPAPRRKLALLELWHFQRVERGPVCRMRPDG